MKTKNKDKYVVTENLYLHRIWSGHLSSDHMMATSISDRRDTSSRPTDLYRNALFFLFIYFWEACSTGADGKAIEAEVTLFTSHPASICKIISLSSFHLTDSCRVLLFSHLSLSLFPPYLSYTSITPLHEHTPACYVFFVPSFSFSDSLSVKSVFHQISPTNFLHNVYRDFFSLFIL